MKDKIRAAILRMLSERGPGKTCCPSEIARTLDPAHWRKLMPEIREVADALQQERRIEISQKHRAVESAVRAVGPIRLRMLS